MNKIEQQIEDAKKNLAEVSKLPILERIELEALAHRRISILTLENFLTKHEGESLAVHHKGLRFFPDMDWTYSQDRENIIIRDNSQEHGDLEILLDEIDIVAERDFVEDMLEIYFNNGQPMMMLDVN